MPEEVDEDEVVKRYIKSIGKGMLKVMSKMGISTYQSYCGAQIFDAVGLKLGLRRPLLLRHRDDDRRRRPGRDRRGDGAAATATPSAMRRSIAHALDVGGEYAYRMRGEEHVWTPDAVATLQHAVRRNAQDRYRDYARLVNEQENELKTIRGLFRIKHADEIGRAPRAARRGRAGARHRQALLDRRDVLRLDLARGARDAGASP